MADSWQCPYCGHYATIRSQDQTQFCQAIEPQTSEGAVAVVGSVRVCPNPACRKYELRVAVRAIVSNLGSQRDELGLQLQYWQLMPESRAKAFPSCIPEPLLNDYYEACAIDHLSPKASATLARRCIQGTIRDFYGIMKGSLFREIVAMKPLVSAELWDAIDALRQVANIGARPEENINLIVDVEQGEAAALIELIELLFRETYVQRHHEHQVAAEAVKFAAQKKALRAALQPAQLPGGKSA
jgi:hypothetical protein